MKKKMLSVLLAVVTVFLLIPVTATAEEVAATEKCTVTFMDEDRSTELAVLTVDKGGAVEPPDAAKEADDWYIYDFSAWVDADGEEVDLSCITEDMTVYASYDATFYPNYDPYDPVDFYPPWAKEAIRYVLTEGIMNGMDNGFQPNTAMSRAMVVTVLHRYLGQPSVKGIENVFTDVKKGEWYYDAVLWAAENGIVNGKGGGIFDPHANVTRQEFVTILYRFADKIMNQSVEYGRASLSSFGDRDDIAPWAKDAVLWACADTDDYDLVIQKGKDMIIMGFPSEDKPLFKPNNAMTRAEFAVMIYRYACSDIPTKREILQQTNPEPEYAYIGREDEPDGELFELTFKSRWDGFGKFIIGEPKKVTATVVSDYPLYQPETASVGIEIIHSYEELQLCLSEAKPEVNGDLPCEYMYEYTEDYFEDKMLVVINRTFSSGKLTYGLTGAVNTGEELCLMMQTELRGTGMRPAVMAYSWQVYEMDRDALDGAKTVSLYAVA